MTDDRLHSRLWLRLLDQDLLSHQAAHRADQLVADRERHADEIAEILRHKGGEVTTKTDQITTTEDFTGKTCATCLNPVTFETGKLVQTTDGKRMYVHEPICVVPVEGTDGWPFFPVACHQCHKPIVSFDDGGCEGGIWLHTPLCQGETPMERWALEDEHRIGSSRPVGPEGETY